MALEHWLPKELQENLKHRKHKPIPENEYTTAQKQLVKNIEKKLKEQYDHVQELKRSLAIEEQIEWKKSTKRNVETAGEKS